MSQAKADVKELIVIPQESALQVFITEGAILPYLEQIKLAVSGQVPDLTTKKGRDEIASMAYKVAQSKTYLEGVGKKLADEQKEIPKKIDATRRLVKDQLDALRDQVRKPLTDWEFEQARIQSVINTMAGACNLEPGRTCADIEGCIAYLEGRDLSADNLGDRLAEAEGAKLASIESLREQYAQRKVFEDEQAELAELRRQKAERDAQDERDRIAREAAERAQLEADQRAQREREAAAQREADLKLQADNAALERIAAEQRAEQAERDAQAQAEQAAANERQRIADEQAQAEAEARAREQDREHRKAINTAALDAFLAEGFTKEQGVQIITLIAQRKIPNISIQY